MQGKAPAPRIFGNALQVTYHDGNGADDTQSGRSPKHFKTERGDGDYAEQAADADVALALLLCVTAKAKIFFSKGLFEFHFIAPVKVGFICWGVYPVSFPSTKSIAYFYFVVNHIKCSRFSTAENFLKK